MSDAPRRPVAAALAALLLGTLPAAADSFVYVSNAKDGTISAWRMDEAGALSGATTVPVAPLVMPMAVSPDRRTLYAGVRAAPFAVHAFAIDGASGALSPLGTAPLPANMLYLATDRSGRWLLSASNSADIVAVSEVGEDGTVATPARTLATGKYPHAVGVDADNARVYLPLLSENAVQTFAFDPATGTLSDDPAARVPAGDGTGPRHIAQSSDGRNVYVVGQFTGEVVVYDRDAASGRLTRTGAVAGLPGTPLHPGVERPPVSGQAPPPPDPNAIWAADIHITPDGRFVFVSERTTSVIVGFRRDAATGALTHLGATPTETQPRGFAIAPDGTVLVAAGEKSGHVAVYRIGDDGALTPLGRHPAGAGANWIEIVSAD